MTKHSSSRTRAAAVGAILLAVVSASLIMPAATYASPSLDASEAEMCRLINTYRASNGLSALKVSIDLNEASDWHTDDMVANNYFSHTDSLGRNASQRMSAFGYTHTTYKSENIAAGNSDPSATLTQWKNSSGHNTTLLSANYKVIGIAKTSGTGTTYGHYWNTTFGGIVDTGATNCPGTSPSPSPTPSPSPPPPSPSPSPTAAAPTISINDVSVTEGNIGSGTANFTVKLNKTSTGTVKVNYATVNASALAGSDYTARSGTVTFPAGTTAATVSIKIIRDWVREGNEFFRVNLTAPVGATFGDAQGLATILNDD